MKQELIHRKMFDHVKNYIFRTEYQNKHFKCSILNMKRPNTYWNEAFK